jgi:hypothetical protein
MVTAAMGSSSVSWLKGGGWTMAKPKPWLPTTAEQALLVDLVTARMPRAAIAKRLGVSEMKLKRFEKRLLSAREAMPPPAPPRARKRGSWLDRLFGDS